MQLIGSLIFTAFLFLWTFFYGIFFVIAGVFVPFSKRFLLARVWARVLLAALRWTCRLDYRVVGAERLPPGAHVALWKHSSSWETIAMAVVCPQQVWVLKRELQWLPVVGLAMRQLHAIGIDRKSGHSAVRQVVEQGLRRLAEGAWIMIFPEGTRMPPGQTRRYGASGALLAAKTGCFVVPIAHDAGYYWPRRGLLKKPGTITVVIGEPIAVAGRDPRDVNEEAQQWIEGTIRELRSGSSSRARERAA